MGTWKVFMSLLHAIYAAVQTVTNTQQRLETIDGSLEPAGGSLTTTECGHLRPQTPVKDSGSLMTTKCGHLRPQNLIFTDRANKTSTVHGVTCDHRMRSLTTTKHFHNRTTEGGGVGGMITYLGLHTDTPKGGLVYRLWACTHAGPFWWVGVGWVGW